MEREKFMQEARLTAHRILEGKENGIMNLVQQAWAEGKRNAEVETLRAAIDEALDKREPKTVEIKPKTTWGEFLCNIGLIHDCTESEQVVLRLFNNAIPADIAEKLGVEAKPKPIDYCREAYRDDVTGELRIRRTPIYPIEPKEQTE